MVPLERQQCKSRSKFYIVQQSRGAADHQINQRCDKQGVGVSIFLIETSREVLTANSGLQTNRCWLRLNIRPILSADPNASSRRRWHQSPDELMASKEGVSVSVKSISSTRLQQPSDVEGHRTDGPELLPTIHPMVLVSSAFSQPLV
jgi:hypothetical protein